MAGNFTDTANGYLLMSHPHIGKDLIKNGNLNLNLEQNTSLTDASPKMHQHKFTA